VLTAICIVSHIENSKNDKGYINYLEHLVRMSTCCLVINITFMIFAVFDV